MTIGQLTATSRRPRDGSRRGAALVAALGLLFMALLAPLANLGVLQTMVVRAAFPAPVRSSGAIG